MHRSLMNAMFVFCFSGVALSGAKAFPLDAQAGSSFDPVAATEMYLSQLSPEEQERSDAYFEGGYWLRLWRMLWTIGVAWLILGTGFSSKMRNWCEKLFRRRSLQTFGYTIGYLLVVAVLFFPLSFYRNFVREHQYGLSSQSFWSWMGDQTMGLMLNLVLFGLLSIAMYAVIRKAKRIWWVMGAFVMTTFRLVVISIFPVFIAPLYNEYTPLPGGEIKEKILSMARANGVPVTEIYIKDASQQSTRINAEVSGFLGTTRISLNDNLLDKCTHDEVLAVVGQEIGHYVLNHNSEMLVYAAIIYLIGFGLVWLGFEKSRKRFGAKWGIRDPEDVAGLPLLVVLLLFFFFVSTPFINTILRSNEAEADIFSLNSARRPDATAQVNLRLAEYRKLDPNAFEEWMFYDHPSGRNRILAAMRWKAEHFGEQRRVNIEQIPSRGDHQLLLKDPQEVP
jgi:STE24 endopeptidase